jgi:hypothetical protein
LEKSISSTRDKNSSGYAPPDIACRAQRRSHACGVG